MCVASTSPGPAAQKTTWTVADFETSVQTTRGGYFHVVGGRPDVIRDSLVRIGTPTAWAWRIDVAADAPSEGAGLVVPLFDADAAADPGARVAELPVLQLVMIGALGDRRARVQIVPHDRGPALTLGTVAPHELHESKWRLLALRLPPETPVRDVRVLLEGGGSGWLALDRISLAADAESQPEGRPRTGRPHDLRKAMWVWNTKRILADPAETSELLAFCERQRLTDVYCQIPYSYHGGAVTLEGADRLRKFTARAQRAGTRLHALDGAPRFVLPEHHERMFALVEALAAFNREEPENARFQAMHLDNEPYLLREWKNIQTRPEVIRDYVALNRELRRRANAADMEFGIDIPFWFDKQDASGGPVFVLEEGDRSVPLLEALFECAQNVGIMSYRERVTGPNGVVACCMTEFGLGARHGVDVFASLELGTGPDVEKGITFGVYAPEYFDEQQATLQHVLSRQVGCAGMAIHYYDAFRALEVRR